MMSLRQNMTGHALGQHLHQDPLASTPEVGLHSIGKGQHDPRDLDMGHHDGSGCPMWFTEQ
ncbi:MAG: hypothetical protein HDS38_05175 [Bacteroides sp.]|nr:hypothetical protein [Bacteroides sp.]